MLFVPLPMFATLVLGLLLVRFVLTRDMTLRAHQFFAALVAGYAVQSLLASLRWGYGVEGAAMFAAILAPVLPALAYLSYTALIGQPSRWRFWPVAVVVVNWVAYTFMPALADPLILMTYLGFAGLLLNLWRKGSDQLPLPPFNDAREILFAMGLTGLALLGAGLMDVYVIYDFIQNDGRNIGLVLTFVQTAFILVIGVSAVFGKVASTPVDPQPSPPEATPEDGLIVARLEALFTKDGLHRSDDLSLRRLSRRLGLSDRQVSNAINRVRDMSVSQFVNDFRIDEACRLLQTTDRTILDISLAAGFATKSNFNREFLRVTGQTPSRWRSTKS